MSERRVRHTLLVIAVTLMVVTAMPAQVGAASAELVVGSQHDTQSEFSSAQQLTNLTTTSSGDGAVELTSKTIDGWEDADDAEYAGDTGNSSAQSTTVKHGSYAGKISGGYYEIRSTTGLPEYPSQGDTWTVWMRDSVASSGNIIHVFGAQSDTNRDNQYMLVVSQGGNSIDLIKRESGSETTLASTAWDMPADTWIRFEIEWAADGTITITAYDSTGTQVAQVSATDTTFTSGGIGWGNGGGDGYYDYAYEGEGAPDSATYLSPTHNVTHGQQAAINITALTNASVTATVQTDSGTILNQTTISSTGNHTLSLDSYSGDKLEVKLEVDITGKNPAFTLADDSILFAPHAPQLDNSSASPQGGEKLTSKGVTLSIPLNDTDFGYAQGDNVTLTWYHKGPGDSSFSSVASKTVSSNGTYSTSLSGLAGGTHEWYVVAKDDYGESTTSDTFTFKVPDTLYVYNESAPNTLIDGGVTVEVTFYQEGENEVVKRSVTDGKVNLTGLEVGESFIVRVESGDYYARTIIIDSLYEKQKIWLLNTSVAAVENQFVLKDLSGQFGEDTNLIIQRPLNISGNVQYRRIIAAGFGVTGHTSHLEKNVRYRIIVDNGEQQRIIGAYLARSGGEITLKVGKIVYPEPSSAGVAYSASEITEDGKQYIRVKYNDTASQTEELWITIYERGNKSNVLTKYHQTDVQSVMLKEPVENNKTSYVVNITADRGDSQFQQIFPVGGGYGVPLPIDAQWLGTISMVSLVFVTALYQSRLATVGSIIVVLVAGSMMLFQFVTINPYFWWGAAAIAVGGHIRATAGGGTGV